MPRKPKPTAPGAAPDTEAMIRVDHAGEYGAVRIYEGQLAILGNRASGDTIRHMAEQEQHHLKTFDRLVNERRVRPTALDHGAEQAPGYRFLSGAIKAGCRVAIKLSEKI